MGLSPIRWHFDDEMIHNAIRQVLGEKISQDLIKEVHDNINNVKGIKLKNNQYTKYIKGN